MFNFHVYVSIFFVYFLFYLFRDTYLTVSFHRIFTGLYSNINDIYIYIFFNILILEAVKQIRPRVQ